MRKKFGRHLVLAWYASAMGVETTARFELQEFGGRFRFYLRSTEGALILTSPFYSSKLGAEQAIEAVKLNASIDGRFDRRVSEAGERFFALMGVEGQILAISDMFSSVAALESGIDFVKQYAAEAPVEDLAT